MVVPVFRAQILLARMTARCLKGNVSAALKRFQAMLELCNLIVTVPVAKTLLKGSVSSDGSRISLVV
jgi:hypothetical protein